VNLKCPVVPLFDLLPDLGASIRYKEVLGRDANSEGSRERQQQCGELQPSHLHPQREHGRRKGSGITVAVQQPSSGALGIVHTVTVEFCGKQINR